MNKSYRVTWDDLTESVHMTGDPFLAEYYSHTAVTRYHMEDGYSFYCIHWLYSDGDMNYWQRHALILGSGREASRDLVDGGRWL
jgi:hypothetical protein